ncbi:MAG: MltA domain-containing protein [Nitrospirae bacterium]|nr:MltA domain-containing protein [Nitrospirota bacterium]
MNKTILTFLALLFLFACARPPVTVTRPDNSLARLSSWQSIAPRDDSGFKDVAAAARQSLEYYKKLPQDTVFFLGPDKASTLDMAVTLQNFLLIVENDSLTADQKVERIKNDFTLYRAVGSDGNGKVLFTGYYEPMLSCRLARDETFRFPLYRRPDDIIEIDLTPFGEGFLRTKLFGRLDNRKVVPYYSREEIDQKEMLAGKDLEIMWCSDIVDIHFLQVQGSGKVDLGDGNILSVLYDGTNGWPYKGIGRYLIDTGAMTRENMSMQAIREYLRTHPDQLTTVLNQNPSYVFFRLDTGPSIGNIGVPLTPGRSIATDSRMFPKGALAFIAAQKPVIENNVITKWVPFSRFVLNQDTGGAIKGAGRADVFFGHGPDAELTAGNLQHEGELYFLMRKK